MKAMIHTVMIALLPLISLSSAGEVLSRNEERGLIFLSPQESCSATGMKASSVKETKANLSFSVKGTRVTGFGVCYGKNQSPSLENDNVNKSYDGEARDIPVDVSFKEYLTDLASATTYYARAYITDSGGKVYYSDEVSFTTEKKADYSSTLNGTKTDFHPNGTVARRYTIKDGLPNGSIKTYSDSGNLVMDQHFVNGIPNGPCVTYFSNGQTESVSNWMDGLPQGGRNEYYRNGQIKIESLCTGEMDNLTCSTSEYFESGGLRSKSIVSGGELLFGNTFDEQGRITSEQKPGNIVSYSYDNDGWKHTSINGAKCQCDRCNR
ncbi:MAG: hypothetical protein U5L72_11955 [Bacteroidales bacterium]|nr:hypothetical protein [Bacteroidales bacterium]